MVNYQKMQIYRIHCNITGEDYYGSTTANLTKRLTQHRADSKLEKTGITSKPIILRGDYSMIWVEDYPCNNKEEANRRERWWIQNHDCVNKLVPGRTEKEFYQDHREEKLEKQKEYDAKHAEDIKVYQKKYREEHKEEKSEYLKKWKEENREQINKLNRASHERNKEKINEARRASYAAIKEARQKRAKELRDAKKI